MNQLNVQHFLKEQSKIIEMLAIEDMTLRNILEKLTETIDYVMPNIYSSFCEYNEQLHSLEKPIGPQLPESYIKAMDGLKVGPLAGSCGTAAYYRELVIVENIMVDPRWEDYKEIAQANGLHACWSIPVISANDELFGTLAFHSKESRKPSEDELEFLKQFGNLAAVIIDKRRSEDELKLANRVIENSPAVIFRWQAKKGWPIDYVSNNVNQFGYTPAMFIKDNIDFSMVIHPNDLPRVEAEVEEYLENHVDQYKQEYRLITADGKVRWIDDRTTVTRDDYGNLLYIEGVLIDITERKEAEQKVFYLANNDPLTGIPNRRYFKKELEKSIEQLSGKDKLAVLYLDCDNFKQINDDLGHDAGDEFLQHLSKRLHNSLRNDDLIARIGGDEFNVLINGISIEDDVIKVAERLIRTSAEPWEVRGKIYHVTLSIGVAIAPDDGIKVDDLIRKADRALYQAKNSGKNKLMWYVPEISI
ncbi:diguanylate cyclase [Filobacillus milosensis]|uniref:Diguanylate cyclase n=1 Tax=Filobacillus milosensis TaxID=94137 RepID=A0A4Y8INM2_9BACI|nr:sensor domain-containing diguanylate cyclase [Filobacillus milosensis]TFB22941.1 diguanylate cyclase [Filobacillus milosensis]